MKYRKETTTVELSLLVPDYSVSTLSELFEAIETNILVYLESNFHTASNVTYKIVWPGDNDEASLRVKYKRRLTEDERQCLKDEKRRLKGEENG